MIIHKVLSVFGYQKLTSLYDFCKIVTFRYNTCEQNLNQKAWEVLEICKLFDNLYEKL